MQWRWFCSVIKTLQLQDDCKQFVSATRSHVITAHKISTQATLTEVPSVYVKSKGIDTVSNTCSTQRKSILYGTESSDVLQKSLTLSFAHYIWRGPLKTEFSSYGLAILDVRQLVLTPSEYKYVKLLPLTFARSVKSAVRLRTQRVFYFVLQYPTTSKPSVLRY